MRKTFAFIIVDSESRQKSFSSAYRSNRFIPPLKLSRKSSQLGHACHAENQWCIDFCSRQIRRDARLNFNLFRRSIRYPRYQTFGKAAITTARYIRQKAERARLLRSGGSANDWFQTNFHLADPISMSMRDMHSPIHNYSIVLRRHHRKGRGSLWLRDSRVIGLSAAD